MFVCIMGAILSMLVIVFSAWYMNMRNEEKWFITDLIEILDDVDYAK